MSTAWTDRLIDEQLAGNLSPKERDALLATRSLMLNGNPTPTHHAIARRAGCSRRTVVRAHQQARALGLLLSTAQFAGANHRRSANRYRLARPAGPVQLCQRWRSLKKALSVPPFSTGIRARDGRPRLPVRTVAEQLAALGASPGGS